MPLVADRTCGACTLCCVLPAIDTATFRKQAGVACLHRIEGEGCAIHAAAPPVCRTFFCGWRELPLLDDAWRPDRSRVLIVLGADEIPPGLKPYQSTKFVVAEPTGWAPTRSFVSYVAALVEARAATYVAAVGPPGCHPLKALVNGPLAAVVARRDDDALAKALHRVVADLAKGPFEPVAFAYPPTEAGGG